MSIQGANNNSAKDIVLGCGGPESFKYFSADSSVPNSVSIVLGLERGSLSFHQDTAADSLSSPIQIPLPDIGSMGVTPTASTTPVGQLLPPADVTSRPTPNDLSTFLVALATQERRVLELKEELSRAEAELKGLRHQWAMHEANKKKADATKHVEELQPPQTIPLDAERRRAIFAGMNKDLPRGKVITGGHTRALSLLPLNRSSKHQSAPGSASTEFNKSSTPAHGSTTMPGKSISLPRPNLNRVRHSFQEGATSGVRQIAEDIKIGLWTFVDDLRQATIGEEATTPKASVNEGRARYLVYGQTQNHGENSSCTEKITGNVVEPRNEDAGLVVQTPSKAPSDELDDDWRNWKSPISQESSRWSNSTGLSSQEDIDRSEVISLPKNSEVVPVVDRDQKQDGALWATLNGFTPSNIQRTASAIMKEWEKSLSPVPEDRHLMRILQEHESKLSSDNLP